MSSYMFISLSQMCSTKFDFDSIYENKLLHEAMSSLVLL